jgi:integrase
LKACQQNTAPTTFAKYNTIAREFREFLKATDKGPMLEDVSTTEVSRFLAHKRDTTAASTANVTRKILSAFFRRAIAETRLRDNPVLGVARFKAQKGERVKKLGFNLDQLTKIYDKAPSDFWRYMIVGEFYTGLRMGDLICLKWGNVDLSTGIITVEPDKVEGKELRIPIAAKLHSLLTQRLATAGTVKPSDYIWPDEATRHQSYKSGSGYFSNQFYDDILVPCGLAPARNTSHKKEKNGRATKRQMNALTFHSLRHSFVSYLKSTGSSQAVAKELAGHASDAVNDLYTHLPAETLRACLKTQFQMAR